MQQVKFSFTRNSLLYSGKYCTPFSREMDQLVSITATHAYIWPNGSLQNQNNLFGPITHLQTQETSAKTTSGRCRRGHRPVILK